MLSSAALAATPWRQAREYGEGVLISEWGDAPGVRAQTRDYDEDLAYTAAIYSSLAYCVEDTIANWSFINSDCRTRTQRFQERTIYSDQDTKALGFVGVDRNARAIVAAFKGTSELRDWITDLSTWVRYPRECIMPALNDSSNATAGGDDGVSLGQVHHGFCEYYQSVAVRGMSKQAAALLGKHKGYSLLVTGHSLGGAAATIAAMDLSLRYGVPRESLVLYTFGSPRTGDASFADNVVEAVGAAYRLVHRRDIVPHLAPCCHDWRAQCQAGKGCPFHHAEEVWYPDMMTYPGANYTLCDGIEGEDNECAYALDLSSTDHKYYFEIRIGGYCDMNDTATMAAVWEADVREDAALEASLPPELLRRSGRRNFLRNPYLPSHNFNFNRQQQPPLWRLPPLESQ